MKLRKPSIKTYSLNPATEVCWLFAAIICLGLGYIISASPFVKAADTTVTATIEPVLSMSLNTNAIDLNIIPSSTGTEEYGSVTLTVELLLSILIIVLAINLLCHLLAPTSSAIILILFPQFPAPPAAAP